MNMSTGTLLVLSLALCATVTAASPVPDAARQSQLLYLLNQDCSACHGMTRKGGLGPSLLPSSLRHRPVSLLVSTILDGRPGTPMPPWRGELSEQDAEWLVQALLRGEGL